MLEKYQIVKDMFFGFDYVAGLKGEAKDRLSVIAGAMEWILEAQRKASEKTKSEEEKKQTLEALKNAKGFIRNYLGKKLYLKYLPDLEFKKDENAEHVEKITRILNELHPESDSKFIQT